jgi:hypothetical protein
MARKVYKNLTDGVIALGFSGADGDTARLYLPPGGEKVLDWPGELRTKTAPGEISVTEED